LVVGVMILSVIAMSGIVIAPSANAAASAGDLIKMAGNSSVYYLGADGKRYVFPNSTTYATWYADFSGVVTIPSAELQSYPLGGNVTVRPGTKLVKITTDPSVYAVEPNGVLRKIQSEAQAAALYGTNWNKRVVDVPDAFFTNYTIGSVLASGATPAGSLVKNATGADIFYYNGTNYRKISNEAALNANRFQIANVITAASTVSAGGTEVSSAEFVNVAQGASAANTVITGSGLMVSLSAATSASATIPTASPASFLSLNLTAANDGAVNVSSLKLTAYELGTATNIDDVTIYDNGVKVGSSKNINSNREAIFSFATPISVAAGTTKTLVVKATAAAAGDYALGIAAASDITATSATVSGSFPIRGNKQSAVASANVGTLQISGTPDTSAVNADFGEDNILLASFTLKANNEAALLTNLKLKNGGTNVSDIVSNLKLILDGNEAATGTYSDGYVSFALNNYKIEKNDSITVEVRGDMGTTNVNDSISLYFKNRADISAIGATFGYALQLEDDTVAGTGFGSFEKLDTVTEAMTISLTASDFTIDADKAATPSKDVKAGDDGVVLATLSFKSNGEDATLEEITGAGNFTIVGTGGDGLQADEISNVRLVDVLTGGEYDLDAAFVADHYNLTLSDEINLTRGVAKKFLVKADLNDATGDEIDVNNTLQVHLAAAGIKVTGDVSNTTILTADITPASVDGSIMTVKGASLAWNVTNLTNKTVVTGASDVEVYAAKLKAGAADGVKLNSLKLTSTVTDNITAFSDNNITKLDLYLDGVLIKSLANNIVETTRTITFSSLDTNSIAAGKEVNLVVKASFSSTFTGAATFNLGVANATTDIVAKSVTGNKDVSVTGGATGGARLITEASVGHLKVELLTSDTNASQDQYILAGATSASKYIGELKFTTKNEPIKVKKLILTSNGTDSSSDISTVRLVKADGTVVASQTAESNGDVIFDPFDITFEADKSTSLFISPLARGINVDGDASSTATQGDTIQYNLSTASSVTASGVNSGTDIVMTGINAITGDDQYDQNDLSKTFTITGVKLNSVVNALADGILSSGSQVIGKYTLTFEHGNNRLVDGSNDAYKAQLDNFAVTINRNNAAVTALGTLTLKVDGTTTEVAEDSEGVWGSTKMHALLNSGKVDDSVTLVITAPSVTIAGAAVNYSVQTVISDLNGTGTDDSIQHNGLTEMHLPYTSVTGGSLHN